jgi:hypothetical protein
LTDDAQRGVCRSLGCAPSGTIARRGTVSLNASMLGWTAAAIRARLPSGAGGEWGVFVDSPFLQLAVLSALQSANCRALLLPHTQPGLIEQSLARCDGLILQRNPVQNARIVTLPDFDTLIAEGMKLGELHAEWHQPVGFMTSGSSGDPECWYRLPEHLIAEIQMIESAFGSIIEDDRLFCGTTSHQHLYGFTFRVMWPYLTGRPLSDSQIAIPSDVLGANATHKRIVFISSPAFLERTLKLFDFDR